MSKDHKNSVPEELLTAWLLHEVDDEEARRIANIVESSPEIKAEVESLRQTIERVQTALQSEPVEATAIADVMDSLVPEKKPSYLWVKILAPVLLIGVTTLLWPASPVSLKNILQSKQAVLIENPIQVASKLDSSNTEEFRQKTSESSADISTTSMEPAPVFAPAMTSNPAKISAENQEESKRENVIALNAPNIGGGIAGGRRDTGSTKKKATDDSNNSGSGKIIEKASEQMKETGSSVQPGLSMKANMRSESAPRSFMRQSVGDSAMGNDQSHLGISSRRDYSSNSTKVQPGMILQKEDSGIKNVDRKDVISRSKKEQVDSDTANKDSNKNRLLEKPRPEPIHLEVPIPDVSGEKYLPIVENKFVSPKDEPLSTFSIDVDTASMANVRRCIQRGILPPADAVRIEELVNSFQYEYAGPDDKSEAPFATHVDLARCPWQKDVLLARIALKGREIPKEKRPSLKLVFLIDVSGSMQAFNKLPLVQMGLTELTKELDERDRVAIVTYAGSAKVHLESTAGNETEKIVNAIEKLAAGGSTAGAQGIRSAYDLARKQFDSKATNRIILCTDGDFNVGMTDNAELEQLIEKEAKSGVFLSVLGFGMGNYKDDRLSRLSNRGNGNYGYIDSIDEARKLLVRDLTGTLITIAKDVKIQVDFNPNRVAAYRLIGYEDRKLAASDFHNDRKDAGDIGAGHTVTAFYEIVPQGVAVPDPNRVDPSRYTSAPSEDSREKAATEKKSSDSEYNDELLFVKLRYKLPNESKSSLLTQPVKYDPAKIDSLTGDCRFAASVALFGMLLRDSAYSGQADFSMVLDLASEASSENKRDAQERSEFIKLVKKAQRLSGPSSPNRNE